jgi:hypothetical protein
MKVQEFERAIASGETTVEALWEQYGAKSLQGDIVGRRDGASGKV